MKRKKVRLTIVFTLLVIIALSIWWALGLNSAGNSTDIQVSGFIEAQEVSVAFEVGGRIAEVTPKEGDMIKAGTLAVRLDSALLKAQEKQSESSLKLAQAQYQQASVARDGAQKEWENAVDVKQNPLELEAKILAARGELETADLNLAKVKEIENNYLLAAAQARVDNLKQRVENFRRAEHTVGMGSSYDRMANTLAAEGELTQAELNLAYQQKLQQEWAVPSAQVRRDNAQRILENLLAIKENPQEINAIVDRTYSAYQTAIVAIKLAEQQIEQAQKTLEVIRVQLSKLDVAAPITGIVIGRHAEVGEIVQPGAPILTIANLEEVTLTIYVPVRQIGLVKLGQEASVAVDSYPGATFTGRVVYLSSQAVFTPRNVQLKEERETMVFAVKIRLANPEQKLKLGMPADARIPVNPGR